MAKPQYALQWWDALIGALAEQIGAEHIELISNGSGVDNEFAYAVWQEISPKYPGLSVCTSIESPADLIQRIGNYKDQIGRAHVLTPVHNAHYVCRLMHEHKKI